jgi:hypothetical protein
MSTYYLVNEHVIWPLGETSFKKFYAEDGWTILETLVNNEEKGLLEGMYIRRDDTSDRMEIEEFLEEIKKYQILLDNV